MSESIEYLAKLSDVDPKQMSEIVSCIKRKFDHPQRDILKILIAYLTSSIKVVTDTSFMEGLCGYFALEAHKITGWQIYGVFCDVDMDNAVHYVLHSPYGLYFDSSGFMTQSELQRKWKAHPDLTECNDIIIRRSDNVKLDDNEFYRDTMENLPGRDADNDMLKIKSYKIYP